ncbi:uncharacterized protein LOC127868251 [Dreissena polymorpha]|uniref:uncharacterized protein LOC127868251 n=1 Tax=Dreissena polymorpha TaxID=45954 RepID=UPI0022655F53|nr:uncharacterized protein LOC127868251 [Dreissena polymorpha]XP_052265843.1 uncharacterized protein LOC127868251 [Dreissena polymorpha]
MPTSSQALKLKKGVLTEDEVRPTSSGHWPGSQCSVPTGVRSGPQYAFRTPAHCSIVTVYNIGQGLVGGGETCRTRTLCTPLGASLRSSSSINRYREVTPASSHSNQTRNLISGVRRAGPVPTWKLIKWTAGPLPVDVGPVPPGLTDRLSLQSTLLLDPDCVHDATSHHTPRIRRESPQKPDAHSGTAARGAVDQRLTRQRRMIKLARTRM